MRITAAGSYQYSLLDKLHAASKEEPKYMRDVIQNDDIKVDISPEAMEKYREMLQSQAPSMEEQELERNMLEIVKRGELMTDFYMRTELVGAKYDYINGLKNGEEAKTPDIAKAYYDTYKKLYSEIVEGYENGTRERYVCAKSDKLEYIKLTKEEELAALDEEYDKLLVELEDSERMSQEYHRQMLEAANRIINKQSYASKKFLSWAKDLVEEEKTREPDYDYTGLSEKMIKAKEEFKVNYNNQFASTYFIKN